MIISLTEHGGITIDGNTFDKEDLINLNRLQKQLLVKENIVADLAECANIWMNYSADLAASWMDFPLKDENILISIKSQHQFTNFTEYSK